MIKLSRIHCNSNWMMEGFFQLYTRYTALSRKLKIVNRRASQQSKFFNHWSSKSLIAVCQGPFLRKIEKDKHCIRTGLHQKSFFKRMAKQSRLHSKQSQLLAQLDYSVTFMTVNSSFITTL